MIILQMTISAPGVLPACDERAAEAPLYLFCGLH